MKIREDVSSKQYSPTMTSDYSRVSDTARAVNREMLPRMASYISRISAQIASMGSEDEFMIADYGTADGVNSEQLFEAVALQVHELNPALAIRLVYIDIADPESFETFWATSALSKLEYVEAQYIQRSFYEPFPEMAGKLQIGFSSTALHWMDARGVGPDFFSHPICIQPNQLDDTERRKFAERWESGWQSFLEECSRSLVAGGAMFLANLANLGGSQWPASAGYNNLRDICIELHDEKKISDAEMNSIFIPDYFATPGEMSGSIDDCHGRFAVNSCDTVTVPCAYFAKAQGRLDDRDDRLKLACALAHVVRAWSESSMRVGLKDNNSLIDDIYRRLKDRFYEKPEGLPYQYCIIELSRTM